MATDEAIRIIGFHAVTSDDDMMTVHLLKAGSPSDVLIKMERGMLIRVWMGIGKELTATEKERARAR